MKMGLVRLVVLVVGFLFSLWFFGGEEGVPPLKGFGSEFKCTSSDISTILSLFSTQNKLNLQLNFYFRIHRLCSHVTQNMITKRKFSH